MAIRALRPIPRWMVAGLVVTALFSLEQVRLWAQACTGLTLTISDSPDPVNPGSTITYTINLSRSTPLLNATLTNVLPPGVTFQSLSAPAGVTCTTPPVGGSGTVQCTFNQDTVYGVTTTNQLITFAAGSPSVAIGSPVQVTGLQPAEVIRGIDFRPATGGLYALGSTSRLYVINLSTGAATQVGSAGAFTLSGTSFGFDVNPVPDRIRVVSDAEQNLRLNPNDGSLLTDTNLSPAGNVVAAAYTNNFAGATVTTLYVIDSASDMLLIQNPPNAGVLNAVGPLGVDTTAVAGFDIAPSGTAYGLLTVGGVSRLYTINLSTGAVTFVGGLPAGTFTGIAVQSSTSVVPLTFTLTVKATSVTPNSQLTNTVSVSSSSESCFSSATATTTVACPAITVGPTSLATGTAGHAYPSTMFTQSGGAGSVTFSTTGTLPPGLTVSAAGALSGTPTSAGTYDFTVIATDANGCTGSRSYSLTINPTPTLTLTPNPLNFGVINAGTIAAVTPAQTLTLTQNGSGTVTWTAMSDAPWLSLSPTSGSGSANIVATMTTNPALLPAFGPSTATVTVTAVGAANSPTATINLNVLTPAQAGAPIGFFDTPTDGQSNVTGAIAVTGWAVDDIGVTRVRILRSPVAPEDPSQLVFIGDAVLVNGARPDIAAAYPTAPLNNQAGWGYLLLTNMLPNQGNGTYTLAVFLDDVDGQTTLLGTKSFTATNATATAPFGTIDTPGQGATVSGSAFINFGWALTPQPRMIPVDGSTIQVLIDSVPIGTVTYNQARADIQQLFPGYANTDGAVGFRAIDTTALSNGVHTIAWIATDNAGSASGLGSRYFTVSNGAGGSVVADQQPGGSVVIAGMTAARDTPPRLAAIGDRSVRRVRTAQLERIVVDLGDGSRPGVTYRGYSIVADQLLALPVGSTLDSQTGVFSWAPGLGFGGTHRLVFVQREAGAERSTRVDVVVEPQSTAQLPARVVIDTPSSGAGVGRRFVVAGWAIDPAGLASGSGIDVLHVWAHPVDGSAPRFLGVAAYGGKRADVAASYGDRFLHSGFGINAGGLNPGTYDVVVYGLSQATKDFSVAGAVRVTVR